MNLAAEQIDFFTLNGYLAVGQLLEPSELELLRSEYDAEFERAIKANDCRNLSSDKTSGGGQTAPSHLYQITQLCERNIHFRRLLYSTRLLDIIESVMGPNIILFEDQALWKPAFTGGRVFWHQDNAYWRCTPANLVSCWLTLDDVVRENGAMQVIPGSHLRPHHHNEADQKGVLLESLLSPEDENLAVVVELPAGGCMLHHCRTLHATAPNSIERQRRAYAMHFMTPGTGGYDFTEVAEGRSTTSFPVGFHHPALRLRL
jgi:phytanoyl-CoA hydroxylase